MMYGSLQNILVKSIIKGPNKGKLSGNPKGKNPSDIWEIIVNGLGKRGMEYS